MKKSFILQELLHHIPFSATATILAIAISIALMNFITISATTFEGFHFAHILFAAFTTAAIYYKYKKSIFKSILIAAAISILVGSISDIIFPWLGSLIFNIPTSLHLPILEIPLIIIFIALIGTILGIATKITKIPHFIHVFISTFASLFYIISYTQISGIAEWIIIFIIITIAIIIPCCLSDIVFPLLLIKKKKEK